MKETVLVKDGSFFMRLLKGRFFSTRVGFFYLEEKFMKKVKEVIGLNPVEKSETLTVEQQDDGYLARHAGMQTVKTSAKGILRVNDFAPQRKKLLGE